MKPSILSSTFHFPEIMLNLISSDVHDSEAIPLMRDRSRPRYCESVTRGPNPSPAHSPSPTGPKLSYHGGNTGRGCDRATCAGC